MAKETYSIAVHGLAEKSEFKPHEQRPDNEDWYRALRDARLNKTTSRVICLCQDLDSDITTKRRLKVSFSDIKKTFWVSSWPYSGQEHNIDCRFYSFWSDEAYSKTYETDVVIADESGKFFIKLPIGLATSSASKEKSESEVVNIPVNRVKRKPTMSLLGLLHFLYEQAGVNIWNPIFTKNKPRDALWLASRLKNAAEKIFIGKHNLADSLLVMASEHGKQKELNQERVKHSNINKTRLISIGLLKYNSEQSLAELQDGRLILSRPMGFPELKVSKNVLNACERSFSFEISAWREGAKVIAIVESEPTEVSYKIINKKNVRCYSSEVISISLMRTSKRFIPVNSSYEAIIEDKLCLEERRFKKPLRYDTSEDVFPDFLLTDTLGEMPIPIEVFGMNTPEYIERKKIKRQFYDLEYGEDGWWFWDATQQRANEEITPFPPKREF